MIVVGVDGSRESQEALRWALAEAELRGSTLRVVHAWRFPYYVGGYGYIPPGEVDLDAFVAAAAKDLQAAVEEVAGSATGVELEQVLLQGPPAKLLVDPAAQPTWHFDWGQVKPLMTAADSDAGTLSTVHVVMQPGLGHERQPDLEFRSGRRESQ